MQPLPHSKKETGTIAWDCSATQHQTIQCKIERKCGSTVERTFAETTRTVQRSLWPCTPAPSVTQLPETVQYCVPSVTTRWVPGGGGGVGVAAVKQMVHPSLVTLPSLYQVNVAPASTATLLGPVDP